MKNFLIILVIFFSLSGYSQKCENSLLWEISGNGLEKPSYIFGTIHMIPTKDYFFEDIWTEKFNQCETLTLEVDMDFGIVAQLSLIKKVMLPDNQTLSDFMSASDYAKYQSFMLDSLNFSSSEFETYSKMKPFFVYSLILTKLVGKDIQMYEMNFTDMAKKNKMDVIGLETIEFQLALVDSIPIEEQIKMFVFNENTTKAEMISEYNKMIEMYKKQDISSLNDVSSESEDIAQFEDELLKDRNLRWIVDIKTIIKHQPTFIAVGAAHLSGDYGILKLLKDEGYTVNPVLSN